VAFFKHSPAQLSKAKLVMVFVFTASLQSRFASEVSLLVVADVATSMFWGLTQAVP